jgi:hypothetical protein
LAALPHWDYGLLSSGIFSKLVGHWVLQISGFTACQIICFACSNQTQSFQAETAGKTFIP